MNKEITIKECCTLFTDGDWIESKDQSDSGIRLIQTGNIGNGVYLEKKGRAKYISEETMLRLGCTEVYPGDILVSRLPDPVGRACIIPPKIERMITAVDCSILRINDEIVDKRYLLCFLNSLCYYKQITSFLAGTTRIRISRKNLERIIVKLPVREKQLEIAKRIDLLTSIINLQIKTLNKLDELIKSRFVEMFGDLADPKCNCEKYGLTYLCNKKSDIKCGPFGTQLSKDEYTDSGIAIWEIPQINSAFSLPPTHFLKKEKAKELQDYSLIAGDIAMSRKGNVGRCAIFPDGYEDGIIHSDVLRIRLNKEKVNPIFIMCQLHFSRYVTKQIELVSHGAIMAGINVTKLKDILLHVPPIVLQNQFADFVSRVEKQKATVQQSIDKLETLKKSLMQEYFG